VGIENLEKWSIDREIVLVRVVNASAKEVFAAWTTPDRFAVWFGPDGFNTDLREMNVSPGNCARFDMRAEDGTVYTNRFTFIDVLPNRRLVMNHGSDIDDAPDRFRVTVTFDEQQDGRTVVTLRQLHQTEEGRQQVIRFGAVELGLQTLRKLDEHFGVGI
jgi:uncharacterized protein YndB with AHSA1/START domain